MKQIFSSWQQGLIERLHECVRLAGDKTALAKRSHMSLAQLYRYLNGSQTPQVWRLFQVAKASGVAPEWLLSGDMKSQPPQDTCSLQTVQDIYAIFEQTYLEYHGQFRAAQKAEILPVLIWAAELEKRQGAKPSLLERNVMLEAMYFLQSLLGGWKLESYLRGMQQMHEAQPDLIELQRFSAMVVEANKELFEGHIGRLYYARMGVELPPHRMDMLNHLYQQIVQILGVYRQIRMLDLGCGNGRHMLFLAKQYAAFEEVVGVDNSALAIAEAQQNAQDHKKLRFYQADVCHTGLPDGRFTFINCMSVMNFMPYVPNTGIGAEALMAEAYRLLQTGGIMHLAVRAGHIIEFMPFEQPYTPAQLLAMAQRQGFKVLNLRHEGDEATVERCVPNKYRICILYCCKNKRLCVALGAARKIVAQVQSIQINAEFCCV